MFDSVKCLGLCCDPVMQVSIRGDSGQCNILKIYDVKPDAFEPVCNYCAGE